ncbi:flagellar basal body rod protein FlgC [Actibacterium sp. 188UL27-1]|uniref:flagellar basal body rod protein FlgC n=1 Tax=Actibacterium sp. 188UL27-1 TaxID=2786961 RepID=UPI00195E5874|nr:flagellar basal body rod protein FlgC [Actibacterium sp. 188UL27-1]MBM7066205.1 flagellar basal body rod protein FlgC [Actibacterium sp. 188UL27-1]
MNDLTQTLAVSASAMKAQSTRLRYISENIANTDTPGFRRKMTSFEQVKEGGEVSGKIQTGGVRLDRTDLPQVFDPSHPMADETGYYEGSNVEMLIEMSDARQAQRSYEANIKMFDQARKMASSLLELLRR